jgi:phosphoglycolate phosphatase-like HAD superfamily hydrolase
MLFDQLVAQKKAFVFDLDNTLYPEKDYLYQVYYMIGQFIEYHETYDHQIITKYLIDEFEKNGRSHIFDKLIEQFDLKKEYVDNCIRLLSTARLPLKLLLFKEAEWMLNELVDQQKQIFILTNGTTDQQLNKITQIEWNGLQKHITCYYANELAPKPAPDGLLKIMENHNLQAEDLVFIGDADIDENCAKAAGVEFVYVDVLVTSR